MRDLRQEPGYTLRMDSYESYAASLHADSVRLCKTAELLEEKSKLVAEGQLQPGHESLGRIAEIDKQLQSLGWQEQPT
jgi:hypothetical protein